ncbi:MAG TPA: 16S rRNA (cytosine(1402)-N(4))-methyltransferase RsmH [Rhizomicrobium sp.]|jgi:16S rRNA (cytosine1402-N4)-methyltransferase|nr:16S rRNA (cytosine(1402)-N(4))-methyltransferase RsmH [Rhizomicrobium sp.]
MSGHAPVMLAEVIDAVRPQDGARYVDGTFGGGGYTRAILDAAQCSVVAIDRDPDAIARGRALQSRYAGRLTLIAGNFSEMESLLVETGELRTDGVILDLGVSSFQFDEAERGFSFREDGPLDMRMSKSGPSAADVVNTADEKTLTDILRRFGEERQAKRIARAIIAARPLTRTRELAEVVSKVLGPAAARHPIHPATRTFQALRIYVNDELGELERGLAAAERVLKAGGRLAVVAFHSLEDRIVKQFLAERSKAPATSRHAPEARAAHKQTFRLVWSGARTPHPEEIARNPRARSARLRAAERTALAA